MKKFYSIIALASMMLTSVFSLSSCQKDEMPSTQAKAPVVQSQKPAVTNNVATTTSTATGNTDSHTLVLGVKMDSHGIDINKKVDTSYAVGEWTATVNDKVYTLVVSSTSADGDIDTEYKATLSVDGKSYDGKFYALHCKYSALFESAEKASDGHNPMTWLQYITLDASNLNEFTAKYLYIANHQVAENVKFIKK